MTKPYRPHNGTDGASFVEEWCHHCIHDRAFRDNPDGFKPGCAILAKTHIYEITDKEYPKEWNYGPDGSPRCTAFEEDEGQSQPQKYHCPDTPDLFLD